MGWDIALEILSFIGASAVMSALIPVKYKEYLPFARKVLELLAANFGGAKNKE
jgi:hypothetical protein